MGQQADPETDDIRVDGVPLGREPEAVYLMLNKPRGYVTTVSDEQGRKTVMDLLTGPFPQGSIPWAGWIGIQRACFC